MWSVPLEQFNVNALALRVGAVTLSHCHNLAKITVIFYLLCTYKCLFSQCSPKSIIKIKNHNIRVFYYVESVFFLHSYSLSILESATV